MHRFVSENDFTVIDLGDGDWVKVPSKISWKTLTSTAKSQNEELSKVTSRLLAKLIVEWNLKDVNGSIAPINEETVDQLDAKTGMAIMNVLGPMMTSELDPKALAG